MSREKSEVTRQVAGTNKEWVDKEVAKLVAEGWTVKRRWEQHGCHFVDLVRN